MIGCDKAVLMIGTTLGAMLSLSNLPKERKN